MPGFISPESCSNTQGQTFDIAAFRYFSFTFFYESAGAQEARTKKGVSKHCPNPLLLKLSRPCSKASESSGKSWLQLWAAMLGINSGRHHKQVDFEL